MVEENVESALNIVDEVIALERGRMVLQRSASSLLDDLHLDRLLLEAASSDTYAEAEAKA